MFTFERYRHELDPKRESMALRFRVDRISDRYGNYLTISYEDLGGVAGLRPDQVKGYTANQAGSPLNTLHYGYTADSRLASIDLPGYGGASVRNTYRFY